MIITFQLESTLLNLNTVNTRKTSFILSSSPYNYKVCFVSNSGLKRRLSKIKQINGDKNFVFVDKKVSRLFKKIYWPNEITYAISATEHNKTIDQSLKLIDLLIKRNFTKKEVLVSIGGGITQDVSAFARAIFKRGIDWIYVPTTLLSMSDSCIGAKSAINYRGIKNSLGLFSAPIEIFINTDFLNTLNKRDILSGYGEIIKLCIIGGSYTINKFLKIRKEQNGNLLFKVDLLIKLSLLIKTSVISKDEFEENIRKTLNYGHTVGHALEPIVNFKIPHGVSVLIGMYIENIVSREYSYLSDIECDILNNLIISYIDDLSIRYLKKIVMSNLLENMQKDKKNVDSNISFAIPVEIGHFKIIKVSNDLKLSNVIKKAINSLINNYD